MNIYFLVEGKRTEMEVYPEWLSILVPQLKKVDSHCDVKEDNYYMFSGNGYPSILNHIENAIQDINDRGGFDYFVVCLDADDSTVDDIRAEIEDCINSKKLNPNTKFEIIIQNKCIETWFLGNTKLFTRNHSNDFKEYVKHYNVKDEDPELMEKPKKFIGSIANFHLRYLCQMLKEKSPKIKYNKNDTKEVTKETFLNELLSRYKNTNHIQSFGYFIDFCDKIKK